MTQKLPLFPLNTVLFPGASLALHVFEERYKLLIGRCLDQHIPFGVVLIQYGREVGGPSISYDVGTTAVIARSELQQDGCYNLISIGQRRFRMQYAIQRAPYIIASVSLLPEESSAGIAGHAQELRNLYVRYWQAISRATGTRGAAEELSNDVIEMTYQLAHRLQVNNRRKQRWLEADVGTRLREISAALRGELALLPPTALNRDPGEWSSSSSWN